MLSKNYNSTNKNATVGIIHNMQDHNHRNCSKQNVQMLVASATSMVSKKHHQHPRQCLPLVMELKT